MTGDRLDACRDTAALIRAVDRRDHEGIAVILDHADNRQVCEILARITVTACRTYGPAFITELCAELRSLQEGPDHDHPR